MKHIRSLAGGAVAVGALALGAVAFGALAIGALAIQTDGDSNHDLQRVEIHELVAHDLTILRSREK